MNVRAKFTCISVTLSPTNKHDEASNTWVPIIAKNWKFVPVTGSTNENKQFFTNTPGGSLELYCVNPNVEFELGKDYYLDFVPASD